MTTPATIMIIEDDPAIRHVLRETLVDEGHEVIEVANGEQALAALEAYESPPDAIVLDLMMPVMDGWAFRAEQLRRDLATGTPVIVLSASRRAQPSADDLSATSVLPKPFDLDDLIAAVEKAIDGRS
jgi:CheY-like chemotaxis protein